MKPVIPTTLLLLAWLMSGCSAVATGTAEPGPEPDDRFIAYIEYNSLQIESRLNITDVKTRKVNDLLQVSVDLQNNWKWTLDFEYKFRFYDKDGFEVAGDGRPWTQLVLSGDEIATVQATAPSTLVESFKITVKDSPGGLP